MPHLIKLQDDSSPCRLWLLVGIFGKVPDPGEHGLRGDPEEKGNAVHGHATQVPQDGVDLHRAWLVTRGHAGRLIPTLLAPFFRLLNLSDFVVGGSWHVCIA
jgi:hypothetical protein